MRKGGERIWPGASERPQRDLQEEMKVGQVPCGLQESLPAGRSEFQLPGPQPEGFCWGGRACNPETKAYGHAAGQRGWTEPWTGLEGQPGVGRKGANEELKTALSAAAKATPSPAQSPLNPQHNREQLSGFTINPPGAVLSWACSNPQAWNQSLQKVPRGEWR